VPVELATKDELPDPKARPAAESADEEECRAAAERQARRFRRLKVNAAAWLLGSVSITVLWVLNQRHANGAFKHFGSHEGNPGDWNPTLWALGVGIWGLVVGIMALRTYFERPPTVGADLRRSAGQP
jgi:hypothetical protein